MICDIRTRRTCFELLSIQKVVSERLGHSNVGITLDTIHTSYQDYKKMPQL